jgi:isoquinoline 1-oxidoreductase alpha subunit
VIRLTVNGTEHSLDLDPSMPLLWAIRDHIGLTGTKYGCGIAQCGSCTIDLNGAPVRACATPLSAAVGGKVTHHRGTGHPGRARRTAGLGGAGRGPVRLLPVWPDHVRRGPAHQ